MIIVIILNTKYGLRRDSSAALRRSIAPAPASQVPVLPAAHSIVQFSFHTRVAGSSVVVSAVASSGGGFISRYTSRQRTRTTRQSVFRVSNDSGARVVFPSNFRAVDTVRPETERFFFFFNFLFFR